MTMIATLYRTIADPILVPVPRAFELSGSVHTTGHAARPDLLENTTHDGMLAHLDRLI